MRVSCPHPVRGACLTTFRPGSMQGANPLAWGTMWTILRTFLAALGLCLAWQRPAADPEDRREHGAAIGPDAVRLEVDARAGTGPMVRTVASAATQPNPHSRAPSAARAPVSLPRPRLRARPVGVLPTGGATRRYRRHFLYLPTAPPRSS